eukprot:g8348.t1
MGAGLGQQYTPTCAFSATIFSHMQIGIQKEATLDPPYRYNPKNPQLPTLSAANGNNTPHLTLRANRLRIQAYTEKYERSDHIDNYVYNLVTLTELEP